MKRLLCVLLMAAACSGSSEEIPSCQQAAAAFYGADCWVQGADGRLTEDDLRAACQESLRTVPDRCDDEMDGFLLCLDAAATDGCDCSSELDALLGC